MFYAIEQAEPPRAFAIIVHKSMCIVFSSAYPMRWYAIVVQELAAGQQQHYYARHEDMEAAYTQAKQEADK
eukprot:scaffold375222_cov53-Prasinocladus_malaysianus.AAC.1